MWYFIIMNLHIDHLEPGTDLTIAFGIRQRVFQGEQGISATDDFDGLDMEAEQFVAYDDSFPIGTARYRVLGNGVGKVERVAVVQEYRGKKVGQAIMEAIARVAAEQGLVELCLDAQLSAASFYKNLGYQAVGGVMDEVGIPHLKMEMNLNTPAPSI